MRRGIREAVQHVMGSVGGSSVLLARMLVGSPRKLEPIRDGCAVMNKIPPQDIGSVRCPETLDLFTQPRRFKPGSQCAKVLKYLKVHGSLSDLEAYMELGIRRLAARVHDLREAGHDIVTDDEAHRGGTHARYRLR